MLRICYGNLRSGNSINILGTDIRGTKKVTFVEIEGIFEFWDEG